MVSLYNRATELAADKLNTAIRERGCFNGDVGTLRIIDSNSDKPLFGAMAAVPAGTAREGSSVPPGRDAPSWWARPWRSAVPGRRRRPPDRAMKALWEKGVKWQLLSC